MMKEWIVIHKIKAMYSEGSGSSIRQIAKALGISRNSVKKYLSMDVGEVSRSKENEADRTKKLDQYKDYVIHLLQSYPQLSAVKVLRKLKEKESSLEVSERSVRRYIESLRKILPCKQERYYQPVLDMVPGVQCQVDPGELRGIRIGGEERTVYFVVFVLSYSRLMYVGLSQNPINTESLIKMHDAAFRYFGGCPEECVYDQTKMVVLHEEYRELELNPRFNEYATYAGFTIRACEGYDPESKGKVEAGVKFVKYNGLYGEDFSSWSELETYVAHWLDTIANTRTHGTTGCVPKVLYEEKEQSQMRPYHTPSVVHQSGQWTGRKADKTGLISWKSNKYSVPLAYQRTSIGVEENANMLIFYDISTNSEIARHELSLRKGEIIKKEHHYRDLEELTSVLEKKIIDQLGEPLGIALCQAIKKTMPKIYKDQLRGVINILSSLPFPIEPEVITRLCQRPSLTASAVKDYLTAYACQRVRHTALEARKSNSGALLEQYKQLTSKEKAHAVH